MTDLFAMISADGEVVEFARPVKITSGKGVENWLKDIRDSMIETVKRKIRDAYSELQKTYNTVKTTEWLLENCGQAIAVVSMIAWTQNFEELISEDDHRRIDNILDEDSSKDLNDLVKIIRDTDLDQIQRKKLTALITHEVHNRDIIDELFKDNI